MYPRLAGIGIQAIGSGLQGGGIIRCFTFNHFADQAEIFLVCLHQTFTLFNCIFWA